MNFAPVQEKRLLKSLAKKGHFTFPAKYGGGLQIDERVNGVDQPRTFKVWRECFGMEIEYQIKYIDGSIYPFLYMKVPKYEYRSSYQYCY